MIHRHLDIPTGTAVEQLPAAALHDLLDRGDLDDWLPILRAIEAEPKGPVTERVARLVDAYPMYGTSPLLRAWIERCRNRAGGRGEATPKLALAAIRRRLGKTQAEVAKRMGITQSDYSKLERRGDHRISTLAAAARALGGRIRLVVSWPDREVEVELGLQPRPRRRS